ncbi:NAD(P)H-binding protein [Sinorhizobium sp. RAC02]|uniref:NAD(P)H-binding protein n=1 Tax=Sinorhizobium sp. RAC02 TaxID=1842534 RepID=UPI00083D6FD5|nr:NAD(P)H-binding protein [Sinorhizobium sp. RAC02]AOF91196.1 nmrA-like family protein [Sinorhizobium sp. RAC02]
MTRILVLGGEGKTGRPIAERLREKGHEVRMGSRSAAIPFDWRDASGWSAVLEGVEAAYIAYQPDLAVPGSDDDIRRFSRLAAEAGVTRLVLLSGRGEDAAEVSEEAMKEAGIAWTVLRGSWFFQNFSEGLFAEPILAGELVLPSATVREPFIDTRDIADVAVAALTEEVHAGKTYELTGPRLMTFREATAEFSAAGGRAVTYTPVTIDAYAAMLREAQMPEDVIWLVTYLFGSVLDGRNEALTHDIERVLGRPPRDFADFARDVAETGFWRT